jgi:hypothetical protein
MKKLILISLLTAGSSLFAGADIGIRVQAPIGNNAVLDLGFRSDDHRYDDRYRNFNYDSDGYRDDFGYFYGYFDRVGYFYNNIFFTYNNEYTYYDRLHRRGYFMHNHPHYREYRYHQNNDWNRVHNYREVNKPIYGRYYDKNYRENVNVRKDFKEDRQERNYRQQNSNENRNNYKDQRNDHNQRDYRNDQRYKNKRDQNTNDNDNHR